MHSCGLRTGEARALQTGQADLQHGHINIVWSKGNRSRRLPVTPQVARVLDACDQQSRARFPGRANFFVSGTGSKVSPCTAGTVFARIWDEAGLAIVDTVTGQDGAGLAGCSDDQLVGIISAARRMQSRARGRRWPR